METNQTFIDWWADGWIVVYLFNEVLLSRKKKWTIDTCTCVGDYQTKDHVLYDPVLESAVESAERARSVVA